MSDLYVIIGLSLGDSCNILYIIWKCQIMFRTFAITESKSFHENGIQALSLPRIGTGKQCLLDNILPNTALHWRHNDHGGVSSHQPHSCLLDRLFRRRSKKTSRFHVTGLCAGNSPGPVNSPHKGPVTRKMVPFDDVIMSWLCLYLIHGHKQQYCLYHLPSC